MNLPAGGRVNDFHETRIVFRGVVHVHDSFRAFRPLYGERLPAPERSGPEAGIIGACAAHDLTRFDRPRYAQILLFDRRRPIGADIPEVVAAERDDSLHVRVFVPGSEDDRIGTLIGRSFCPVHFHSGNISPVFRSCGIYRMRDIKLRRRRRRRRRFRRRGRRRRGRHKQRRNGILLLLFILCSLLPGPAQKQEQDGGKDQDKQGKKNIERRLCASSSPPLLTVFTSAGRTRPSVRVSGCRAGRFWIFAVSTVRSPIAGSTDRLAGTHRSALPLPWHAATGYIASALRAHFSSIVFRRIEFIRLTIGQAVSLHTVICIITVLYQLLKNELLSICELIKNSACISE